MLNKVTAKVHEFVDSCKEQCVKFGHFLGRQVSSIKNSVTGLVGRVNKVFHRRVFKNMKANKAMGKGFEGMRNMFGAVESEADALYNSLERGSKAEKEIHANREPDFVKDVAKKLDNRNRGVVGRTMAYVGSWFGFGK